MNNYSKNKRFLLFAVIFLTAATEIFAVQNGKIAFVSARTGNLEIYTMNPDGSNQTNITTNPAHDSLPDWSFDGGKIAFVRSPGGGDNSTDIYTMNADGSNQVRLTNDGSSRHPSWSPDGTKIVFATGFSIYLINADGTNPIRLPTINYNDDPEFSPDGSRISFMCSRPFDGIPPSLNDEICVMNADGTNERILSKNPAAEWGAVWSPDGSKIAFVSQRSPSGGNGAAEVYVMNADGSNQVNLSNNPAYDSSPEWLPDGTKIAFSSSRDNTGTYLMNPDGSNQTFFSADVGSPTWQRVVPRADAFDFDGDGKTDLSVYRNGTWLINPSSANNPNSFYGVAFGNPTDRLVPADYDGDGKTDYGVVRPYPFSPFTHFFIRQSSTNAFSQPQFGSPGDIPVPGYWDEDGRADLAVYRPGTTANPQSYFYYRPSLQPGVDFISIPFGTAEDKPVIADYDGDGKADAAVFRPSTGVWYILRSRDGFYAIQFGLAEDKPVVGDYDGDGKADFAVFRPSNGFWYILKSTDNSFSATQFGTSTDKPVPGDYDGDGKTDYAVYRDGTWFLLNSTNGFAAFVFGTPTDKPVPNTFIP